MSNIDDFKLFLRAFACRNTLKCVSILGTYQDNVEGFVEGLTFALRQGLYADESDYLSTVRSIGLNNSADLLGACLSKGNKEVALLKAIAMRGIHPSAEKEYQSSLRVERTKRALEEGAKRLGSVSEGKVVKMSSVVDTLFN